MTGKRRFKHRLKHFDRKSPCILIVARTMITIDQNAAIEHGVASTMGKTMLG